ncbi:MAG: hypothetical protein COC01_06430 [Bacteroidetes bacterium]|nr:MAG: hypothetical protein COC01_06430 [Bacteroidota bacterium]
MKNKNIVNIATSTASSYFILKSTAKTIDPYTRMTTGIIIGIGMSLSENPLIRFLGIGISIGSILQLVDVKQGGKLITNDYSDKIYVLLENGDVKSLNPYEIPSYSIDGLTIKGLNKVFKVSDGIYVKISNTGEISETFGMGKVVNSIRMAGLKSKEWVLSQTDKRWEDLYQKSIKG